MRFKLYALLFFTGILAFAQPLNQKKEFTKQDSLRGSNNEFRNWWDVKHYDISISPYLDSPAISGKVIVDFEILNLKSENNILQLDLQSESLKINKIYYSSLASPYFHVYREIEQKFINRAGDIYFVNLDSLLYPKETINKDSETRSLEIKSQLHKLKIEYNGTLKTAKNPPWDGGWVFNKDNKGRPWISAAVQGLGASAWFPNKDYQGDEPDNGANITIIVPNEWVAVSNGKLVDHNIEYSEKGLHFYQWEVKNPINNYNIIPYIGAYEHFSDTYKGKNGQLDLDYYVLDYNLEKAKEQFKQVKPMLKCFEDWFGPYPFYEDGFKLVESPYLGMEHQSNIAYGNQYLNGYLGSDLSGTGHGLKWDFIIIHESGHEWFGNNITTKDIADMWVHEGFTHYSEVIYTQCQSGKEAGDEYARGLFNNIRNDIPIIGKYGVNQEGSGDMYAKGAALIHTLRQLMENDRKFKQMLRKMNKKFYHKTVTSKQIEDYISDYTKKDLSAFFNQYLRTVKIPILEIAKDKHGLIQYRYTNIVEGFDMPLKLQNGQWIFPTNEWKTYKGSDKINVDPNFLVRVKQN